MAYGGQMCQIPPMPFLPLFLVASWLLLSYPDAGAGVLCAYLAFVAVRRR